jgi:hypothetical protein
VYAVLPLIVRGRILGLLLVKLLVILQVSFMLLVLRLAKVFCQVLDNYSFIAESICSFRELMRGRRVMSWVRCHCARSLFLFCISVRVDVEICIDFNSSSQRNGIMSGSIKDVSKVLNHHIDLTP